MNDLTESQWGEFLKNFSNIHLLQTAEWGMIKKKFGWDIDYVIDDSGSTKIGAQILFRTVNLGFTMAYIPKGPVYDKETQKMLPESTKFWDQVDSLCRQRKAVFLKIEPDLWISHNQTGDLENNENQDDSIPTGFLPSSHSIQPPRTLLVSLKENEEEILSRMKQKTRYNIRLSQRRGVQVVPSDDLVSFYELMKQTGERDKFNIHSIDYYRTAFNILKPLEKCNLLIAVFENVPIATIFVFSNGRRAWYFYGASSNEKRELMPTYFLQWEAMRWARKQGCVEYDLWGVPDHNLHDLENNFEDQNRGLWGVYRFKRGFGGELKRAAGPWDRIYNPVFYKLYQLRNRYLRNS